MRNDIYILCQSLISQSSYEIRVFEDGLPSCAGKEIEIKRIISPFDIGSSEKEQCLYVSDHDEKCVWKINRDINISRKIIKWLKIDYQPRKLSMTSDDQLLMINESTSSLMLYGSDAELILSVQLPQDIKHPDHAVETSIGNFIVLHEWAEIDERDSGTSGKAEWMWIVSELTRDAGMVIRRFMPSNEDQQLNDPVYLSLDSNDRLFVADMGNGRVILLDSCLKWNQILYPRDEDTEENMMIRKPLRLCYDEEDKQLIVLGDFDKGFNVCNFILK